MCNCGNCPACRKGLSLPVAGKFKPGDVAMILATNKREPYRAYFDGSMWREYGCPEFCVITPLTHRPLVVIDPEQIPALEGFEGTVGDILHQMADDCRDIGQGDLDATETALRWLADQMPKTPKPEEPTGLGAVVEDESGERWVRVNQRTGTQEWRCCDFNGEFRNWPAIAAVRVLSEGVRDE